MWKIQIIFLSFLLNNLKIPFFFQNDINNNIYCFTKWEIREISSDPTVKQEGQLQRFPLKLKKKGVFNKEEYLSTGLNY